MAIYVSDALTLTRNLINDPLPTGRWTDTALINFIDRGVKQLVGSLRFPESRLTQTATPNQQLYTLPDMYQFQRVYVAGQEVPCTLLNTLEGNQIYGYDQTATGTPNITGGSDAPPGAGGTNQTQWDTQTALVYPVQNNISVYTPATPWYPGQRPVAYRRGGAIGFVPAPSSAVSITIDCILVPTTLTTSSQQIVVPDNFLDAICWYAASMAKYSDDNDRSSDQRNFARQAYEAEVKKLRTWKRTWWPGDSFGPFPRTYRTDYGLGNNRWGSDGPGDGS